MYAVDFDYHRAKTVRDAQQLLQQNPGAKLLAGGHSLLPLLKLRLGQPGRHCGARRAFPVRLIGNRDR